MSDLFSTSRRDALAILAGATFLPVAGAQGVQAPVMARPTRYSFDCLDPVTGFILHAEFEVDAASGAGWMGLAIRMPGAGILRAGASIAKPVGNRASGGAFGAQAQRVRMRVTPSARDLVIDVSGPFSSLSASDASTRPVTIRLATGKPYEQCWAVETWRGEVRVGRTRLAVNAWGYSEDRSMEGGAYAPGSARIVLISPEGPIGTRNPSVYDLNIRDGGTWGRLTTARRPWVGNPDDDQFSTLLEGGRLTPPAPTRTFVPAVNMAGWTLTETARDETVIGGRPVRIGLYDASGPSGERGIARIVDAGATGNTYFTPGA
jgi:hypothetical protein